MESAFILGSISRGYGPQIGSVRFVQPGASQESAVEVNIFGKEGEVLRAQLRGCTSLAINGNDPPVYVISNNAKRSLEEVLNDNKLTVTWKDDQIRQARAILAK